MSKTSLPIARQRRCPCGCGFLLSTYNGDRAIVCLPFWKTLPQLTRARYMNASSRNEKRRMAREILTAAKERTQIHR